MTDYPNMQVEPLETGAGALPPTDGLLCVDTEDWYQIMLRNWGRGPRHCRTEFRRGLAALLEILARHGAKATFFVLGMTAAEDPGVVSELAAAGHEIATHGYAHIHLERRTLAEFADDLRQSLDLIGPLAGGPILGHRAPEFSVSRSDPAGFFRVVAQSGLRYDSSVVPFAGPRYGLPGFLRVPCRIHLGDDTLVELPLATMRWAGRTWPVAGGGYWRLMPRWLLLRAAARVRGQGVPLTVYLHNYEFDPRTLDISGVADASEFKPGWRSFQRRQNLFRRTLPGKLEHLLGHYRFACCRDFLERQGWLDQA